MLGVVCVREWLLVFLSFFVQMPGTSPRWPLELCLLFCLQSRCCIPCYGAELVLELCLAWSQSLNLCLGEQIVGLQTCSSKQLQCLPNYSIRALPVIVRVLFASKRSVGVEAPSATRGLKMTCMYQVIKVVHNPFG